MRKRTRRGVPGRKIFVKIEQNRLLAAGGKAEIRLGGGPSTATIRNFDAHALRVPAIPLRHGDVDRGFGVVNRALRDQIERAGIRSIVAEIDFNVVIAGDALILAAAESSRALCRRAC